MNKTISTTLGILIIILVTGVAGASVLLFNQGVEEQVALEEENFVKEDGVAREDSLELEEGEKTNLVNKLWEKLPQEITIGKRTVILDTESLEPTERTEFSEFPYVIRGDKEVKMEDYLPEMKSTEDPLEYAKRVIEIRLENMFGENGEPSHLGQYSAFFYHTAEGRVVTYIRGMNYMGDSIGGSEFRIDFQIENNEWEIIWAGHRYYCRRMDAEYWSPPADKLCP